MQNDQRGVSSPPAGGPQPSNLVTTQRSVRSSVNVIGPDTVPEVPEISAVQLNAPNSSAFPPNDASPNELPVDPTFPRNLYIAETPETTCSSGTSLIGLRRPSYTAHQARLPTPTSHRGGPDPLKRLDEVYSDLPLPGFVSGPSLHLAQDDLAFLKAKEVFHIPPMPVLMSVIEAFVNFVYPMLPIIDLHQDLETVILDGTARRISLPLLYAIVLAGIAFTDEASVIEAGYDTRPAFAKAIYKRLRVRSIMLNLHLPG